jgi:D-3-phosphoglycerate dehydrogenase
MAKVLVCDPMDSAAMAALQGLPGVEVTEKTGMDEATLIATVPGYDAMVVRSATKVTAPVIDAMDTMKVIIRGGVGLDNIDQGAAATKGVKVRNTPAASSNSVAELALGMMFALARKIAQGDASMKRGEWNKKAFKGTEIMGKTLGLVGFGRIARCLAEKGLALGMKEVLACDPYVNETGMKGARITTLEEVLEKADYLSLHVPKTDETAGMISDAQFSVMKPTAFLINCARGGVVDEPALARALKEGKITGAAIDVYDSEPCTDSPFHSMDNVILMPHVGAQAAEGQARVGMEVVDIVREELV